MGRMKWRDLRAELPPESIEKIESIKDVMRTASALGGLRKARRLTQEELADRLGIRQANVSKMERRLDMRVSTLREVVEAMGGELRITAAFPDAEYRIDLDRADRAGQHPGGADEAEAAA